MRDFKIIVIIMAGIQALVKLIIGYANAVHHAFAQRA